MRQPELRDEDPPDDVVVVVRGGLHSLDPDKVVEVCEDSFADFGFYGVSVFAALDGDVEALCKDAQVPTDPKLHKIVGALGEGIARVEYGRAGDRAGVDVYMEPADSSPNMPKRETPTASQAN